MWSRRVLALLVALLAVGVHAPQADASSPSRWQPRPGLRWQIQFTGPIDLSVRAHVFELDGFATPRHSVDRLHAAGRRAVCYISAGSFEDWRPDAGRYPAAVLGRPLDDWPGERWLDIRRLDLLGPILRARVAMCDAKGFDAIDFDNVDGYTHDTGFPLTAGDQLRFNRWLAAEAHRSGLAVALKNDLEQVPDLASAFDFAVNESCWSWRECGLLRPFRRAGKPVLVIEYAPVTRAEFCPTVRDLGFDGIRKRMSLDAHVVRCT